MDWAPERASLGRQVGPGTLRRSGCVWMIGGGAPAVRLLMEMLSGRGTFSEEGSIPPFLLVALVWVGGAN